MKKIKLLLLSVFIATSIYTYGEYVNFIPRSGETQFISIDAIDTSVPPGSPIILKRGTSIELKCHFTAPNNYQSVNVKCHWIINGIPLPIPIQPNTPTWGMQLPLVKGRSYNCYIPIFCQNSLSPMACKLRIELHAENGTKLIAGADIDVKIR